MTKFFKSIKQNGLFFSARPWSAYLMLFGLFGQVAAMATPTVLAQGDIESGYSLVVLSPAYLTISEDPVAEENEFLILDETFIKSACLLDSQCSTKAEIKAVRQYVTVTAYSSTADQTDSSPFITANGTHVSDGIVACNFLPFGTKVRFPEYSGDKIYVVADRMAKKNSHKIDIWMESRGAALEFGVQRLTVEILEGA